MLGSIVVEIETRGGKVGVATGLGGPPACFVIEKHFRRFLVGRRSARHKSHLGPDLPRYMPYGRKGVTVAALSVVDLALWDLLGILRDEPVYALIGGSTRDAISLYCTGPRPDVDKAQGFWGGKVPLPHGPADGPSGLKKNVEFLAAHREARRPRLPADGRLLHGTRRALCRVACRGAEAASASTGSRSRSRQTISRATAS